MALPNLWSDVLSLWGNVFNKRKTYFLGQWQHYMRNQAYLRRSRGWSSLWRLAKQTYQF